MIYAPHTTTLRLAAALGALSLTLAACGGSDPNDSDNAISTEVSAADTASTPAETSPPANDDSTVDEADPIEVSPPSDEPPVVDLDQPLDDVDVAAARDYLMNERSLDPTYATCIVTEMSGSLSGTRTRELVELSEGSDDELDAADSAFERCREFVDARNIAPGNAPTDEASLLESELVTLGGEEDIESLGPPVGWLSYEVQVPAGTELNGDWNFDGFELRIDGLGSFSSANLLEQEIGYAAGEGDDGVSFVEERGDEQWGAAYDTDALDGSSEIVIVREFIVAPGGTGPPWDYGIECQAGFYQDTPFTDAAAVEEKLNSICSSIVAQVLPQFALEQ